MKRLITKIKGWFYQCPWPIPYKAVIFTWEFKPKVNITAYELWQCRLPYFRDTTPKKCQEQVNAWYDKLPKKCKRHFKSTTQNITFYH